jgi:hypothetical protein
MKIRFAPYWMGILVAFANSAGSQQADVVPDELYLKVGDGMKG